MALKNTVGIELNADVDNDGQNETALFELATDVQIERQLQTSLVLNQTGDRVLGALQAGGLIGFADPTAGESGAPKRSGVTLDTGGGRMEYRLSFREPDGGQNSWGDTSDGSAGSDATGDSARRKANVLMRYFQVGTFDSNDPAKLYLGEYESRDGTDGVYEDFIPCTVKDVDLTIDAESDQILDGQITLVRVGTLGSVANDGRRDR